MSEHIEHSVENQVRPWWFWRCIHRSHYWEWLEGSEYGCWRVLREAEGVAILHLVCTNQVHVVVELTNVGSICKTLTYQQYKQMEEPEIMALVQSQFRELKSLHQIPE